MGYGDSTKVSVSRTKSQIEDLLYAAGASAIMTAEDVTHRRAFVAFQINGRNVRLDVPMPDPNDHEFRFRPTSHGNEVERIEVDAKKKFEQAKMARWRATWLLVRAKLEAIAMGHSTIEREFLYDMLMGDPRDSRTFGDALRSGELDQLIGNGTPLLPERV